MPFAGYRNFDDCHDDATARRIGGRLQEEAENANDDDDDETIEI